MRAVVMAGGAGERFWGAPKPLMRVCGKTMLSAVVEAAAGVAEAVYVAAPPRAFWAIREGVAAGAEPLITPGLDYATDLVWAVERVGIPALILPADMPFLRLSTLEAFVRDAGGASADLVTLVVTGECFPDPRPASPAGIALIKGKDWWKYVDVEMCVFPDLFDVDTMNDLKVVAGLCG